jgi:hypothetical protein
VERGGEVHGIGNVQNVSLNSKAKLLKAKILYVTVCDDNDDDDDDDDDTGTPRRTSPR